MRYIVTEAVASDPPVVAGFVEIVLFFCFGFFQLSASSFGGNNFFFLQNFLNFLLKFSSFPSWVAFPPNWHPVCRLKQRSESEKFRWARSRVGEEGGAAACGGGSSADRRGIIRIMARQTPRPPPPFPLPLFLYSTSLWLPSLARPPGRGLGYHGNQRNALFCGMLALDLHGPSAQLWGGVVSPESLNNDWETTPRLSLSLYISIALMFSLHRPITPPPPLCCSVWGFRLKLSATSASRRLNESLWRGAWFSFPQPN